MLSPSNGSILEGSRENADNHTVDHSATRDCYTIDETSDENDDMYFDEEAFVAASNPGSWHDNSPESSILQDIENRSCFSDLGSSVAAKETIESAHVERGRSATTTSHASSGQRFAHNRKGTQESIHFQDTRAPHRRGFFFSIRSLLDSLTFLKPDDNQRRFNIYLFILFLVVVSIVARSFAPANRLLLLYACSIGLEFVCSAVDSMLFKIVDIVFASRFDVAYQLHSLNGPFGLLLTVLIMRANWHKLGAEDVFPGWDNLITAATVLIICLCGKNWLTRKQYVTLLESRFVGKVESLNTMIIILSELASSRPPKSVQLQRANDSLRTSPAPMLPKGKGKLTKVRDVFADLVDSDVHENTDESLTRRELYKKRRSFWQSAARLNSTAGTMQVITYNGIVTINNQEQARTFGKKLYKHLSKSGKVVVTPELLQKLFEERRETVTSDVDEKYHHDQEMSRIANMPAYDALSTIEQEEKQELWTVAVGLLDPYNLGKVSEDFCVEAVLNIYKEQRFTAASINDFGELHQSLRIGIDIVYWIVMLFVLQSIFGFDLTSYLLPFITLLLTLSFAIAPLVGNVFLAFAFVFFMSPYEVGHKVQIGMFNAFTPPIIGNIKSVSLMYTIITTEKMELVKIPNHALYGERIYNLTETSGAVHEFSICFNIFGASHAELDKIRIFFQRLKFFTLRESTEWKSFLVCASNMDTLNNSMEYKVYCVHREGWGFYQAVSAAKIEYFAKIKQLREEMGLHFMLLDHPITVTQHTQPMLSASRTS